MKKILVTGGNGLVGNAIKSISNLYPDYNFVYTTHQEADLTNRNHVRGLFNVEKPNYVIHTAARVGGIGKNLNSPAQQFYNNILMNTHVIHEAYEAGVEKLLAFSSVCAFPDHATVLREDILHDGPPYYAHGSYAYSKRMVDIQIKSYRKQYDIKHYTSVLPVNIFGEHDNYDLENGHVVPSLIRKCYDAKEKEVPFEVWGTGIAKREFCYAADLAKICVELLKKEQDIPDLLIVSDNKEYSIKELVEFISKHFNYDNIRWLSDKPNGQLRRSSDTSKFRSLFPDFQFTPIEIAMEKSVNWFVSNYPNIRGV